MRFATLVLDVDSTLSRTEGIEWLANRRTVQLSRDIRDATDRAMNGDTPMESVYRKRLELIRPSRSEIDLLGEAYIATASPGALDAVNTLRQSGLRIVIVSGGIREAILPLAAHFGIPHADVHAVSLSFSDSGEYQDFDHESPLTRNGGKPILVRALELARRILALGDGISDAELKTDGPASVDMFVAFTGVARREPVVQVADRVIQHFNELPAILRT